MKRLTIPDKKIEGGVRRAFIDTKAVKENAMTIYWALKKVRGHRTHPGADPGAEGAG